MFIYKLTYVISLSNIYKCICST